VSSEIKAESKDEQILAAVLATDAHFSVSYIIDLCGAFPATEQPLSGQSVLCPYAFPALPLGGSFSYCCLLSK